MIVDVAIGSAKDPETKPLQLVVSKLVGVNFLSCAVCPAIDFDDDPSFSTNEIHKVAIYSSLTHKLQAAQTSVTKFFPELSLGRCGIGA